MLKTKCIFKKPSISDGLRISVMSRHTLNDGVTPDLNLVYGRSHEIWYPFLAPDPKLVGSWYKGLVSWEEFRRRYLESIAENEKVSGVRVLAKLSLDRDVTILCAEESPEFCHRRLLAEECKRYFPELDIKVE